MILVRALIAWLPDPAPSAAGAAESGGEQMHGEPVRGGGTMPQPNRAGRNRRERPGPVLTPRQARQALQLLPIELPVVRLFRGHGPRIVERVTIEQWPPMVSMS